MKLRFFSTATAAAFFAGLAFVAPAKSAVLFSQVTDKSIGVVSDTDFSTPQTRLDNFILSNNSIVQDVSWQGIYYDAGTPQAVDAFTIRIYSDNSGALGSLQGEFVVGNAVGRTDTGQDYYSSQDIYSYSANLSGGLALSAGSYWLAVYNDTSSDSDDNWYWVGEGNLLGGDGSQVLFFSNGSTTTSGVDFEFSVSGVDVSNVPIPATLPLFASGLGALSLLGWRRKRKAQAAIAA